MNKRFWDHDGWKKRPAFLNRRMQVVYETGLPSYWATDCRGGKGSIASIRYSRLMRAVTS